MNQEIFVVCEHILTKAGILFTRSKIQSLLKSSPNFPSILSIQETLSYYGIESAAVKRGKHHFNEFDTPFICSIQREDWPYANFTVVESVIDSTIEYLDPVNHKLQKTDVFDFEMIDKEVILLLDLEAAHDEPGYTENIKKDNIERNKNFVPYFLVFTSLIFTIYIIWFSNNLIFHSVFTSLILLTGILGFIVSIMLVWHDIDINNPFLKEVCGGNKPNSRLSCDVVLASKGASFLSIKWSEFGISYFITQLISTFLFADNPLNYLLFWSICSLIASPYIIYSIYYQAKVIKRWCPLCLIIQGILFIDLLITIIFLKQFTVSIFENVALASLMKLFFLGGTILFLVHFLVSLLKEAFQGREYKRKLQSIAYDNNVFNALVNKTPSITIPKDDLGIVIGNLEAPIEITKVCNPLCGPCSRAHPILEDIIESNPQVKMRVIFIGNGDDASLLTAPVTHFLALQEKQGMESVKKALDFWYRMKDKNYSILKSKFPVDVNLDDQKLKMKSMDSWCNEMKIRVTPTIFINGREMPDQYEVSDLKYFLID
ncbi:MAG: thioredoxin domain-containing protein [Sphingobacterium sp.]|nr:thioredoxin domain-containing protein [Sphingobacterium sp.]